MAEKQAPPELLLYDISIFGSDTNAVTQRLLYKQEDPRLAPHQNNFNIGFRQHSYFTMIYTETFGENPGETRKAGG